MKMQLLDRPSPTIVFEFGKSHESFPLLKSTEIDILHLNAGRMLGLELNSMRMPHLLMTLGG